MSNKYYPGIVVKEYESRRGCGYRKVGGMYLVSDGPARECGKMPVPLEVCPCCGQGIKFSRSPVWIEEPDRLWADFACISDRCFTCPMTDTGDIGPSLLIWIGEKFYPTPSHFNREANIQGISRRIKSVPRNFVMGETWVLLAHAKAIELNSGILEEPDWQPGIFRLFRPTRIEIIITGEEPDNVIENYLERGLTPVLIEANALHSEPVVNASRRLL